MDIKEFLLLSFGIIFLWFFIFSTIIVFECEYGDHIIIISSPKYSSVDIIDWDLIKTSALISTAIIILGLLFNWVRWRYNA